MSLGRIRSRRTRCADSWGSKSDLGHVGLTAFGACASPYLFERNLMPSRSWRPSEEVAVGMPPSPTWGRILLRIAIVETSKSLEATYKESRSGYRFYPRGSQANGSRRRPERQILDFGLDLAMSPDPAYLGQIFADRWRIRYSSIRDYKLGE